MKYYVAFWAYANGIDRSQIIYADSWHKVEELVVSAYPAAINITVQELIL